MKLSKLRNTSFHKWFGSDQKLNALIEGFNSHAFLANPPIANIYQYLTDYVTLASEEVLNKNSSGIKVLDWGTGKGHVSYLLKNFGFKEVVSCDIEDVRQDSTFGQEHPIIDKLNIKVVPLKHDWILPFEDESFDVVVSYGVLEHVPNDLESLKEINRILKSGGLLFCFHLPRKLGYVHFFARLLGDNYHDRLYNRKSIKSHLNKSNFEILDLWERTILPKNKFNFIANNIAEKIDLALVKFTPFSLLSTNIEFLAQKK